MPLQRFETEPNFFIFGTVVLILSIACPAHAQTALDRLEQQVDGGAKPAGQATPPAREPGYLGMVVRQQRTGRPGVRVVSVRGDGPAEQAGLLPGDLVVAVGGRNVARLSDVAAALGKPAAGDKIQLVVERNGTRRTIEVVLGRRPPPAAPPADFFAPAPAPPGPPERLSPESASPDHAPIEPPARALLGVRVVPAAGRTRPEQGALVQSGAVIESIQPGSPADRYGLPLGGVIVRVDNRPVDDPADLAEAVAASQPGRKVEIAYYQGGRLYRKAVRLAPSPKAAPPAPKPAAEPAPADDAPLKLVPGVEDRRLVEPPSLKAVEEAIASDEPDEADKTDTSRLQTDLEAERARSEALRRQVQTLKDQVEELQRRLAELEAKLKAS